MKIAILIRNFSASGGGAERYAVATAFELANLHDVHVFSQEYESPLPGIKHHAVPAPCERPRWINQIYFAWKTWRLTRLGFDRVISHENTWHGDVQVVHVLPVRHMLWAERTGLRWALLWLRVMSSPRLLAYLWLEAMRYRRQPGRQIVATSGTLAQVIVTTYPSTTRMLRTITPGVDATAEPTVEQDPFKLRRDLGLPTDVPLLLFVGNDMRKKGLPTLLKVMADIPNVHLAVVGQGEHTQAMQKLAEPLRGRVHFRGAVPEMFRVYRAADMLVHPTLEDTYAMVVLEAMSHGLVVVVSDSKWCGIAKELIDERDAVILKDPLDTPNLTCTLLSLLGDDYRRKSLSANARIFAANRSWSYVGLQFDELINEKD